MWLSGWPCPLQLNISCKKKKRNNVKKKKLGEKICVCGLEGASPQGTPSKKCPLPQQRLTGPCDPTKNPRRKTTSLEKGRGPTLHLRKITLGVTPPTSRRDHPNRHPRDHSPGCLMKSCVAAKHNKAKTKQQQKQTTCRQVCEWRSTRHQTKTKARYITNNISEHCLGCKNVAQEKPRGDSWAPSPYFFLGGGARFCICTRPTGSQLQSIATWECPNDP